MRLFGDYNIKNNQLYLGKYKISDLGDIYETPLYIYDENLIRENIRKCKDHFGENGKNIVAYAGKAFLVPYMCKILKEEKVSLDVVSGGELYIAYTSGFPMENVLFHGNNKSEQEISMGIDLGVGRFVVDNFRELQLIEKIAMQKNKKVKVLLRVTPGIEVNTHKYIKTGSVDTKFGFSMIENEYIKAVEKSIKSQNIDLVGIHCHIGSQIFDPKAYEYLSYTMMDIAKTILEQFGYQIKELDLGGGFGVYYNENDKSKEIQEYTSVILQSIKKRANELNMTVPTLIIEPGRFIVANSGITVYKVGAIKKIPNVRKYVAVDGGMPDNIRPALYDAKYEFVVANKVYGHKVENVTIAGKCCESGDILIKDVYLPILEEGDTIAVLSTGAYGYSMASNYNMALKPAVIFVNNDDIKLVCKRQTFNDLLTSYVI
ncbi:diaminopimelate decarboxylase [Alkalithermobacter thermoalcaliphilus JW-YL-7 = DSM 7308]|uniref:Diaminopimelate decarboxylase n=1 Tax=Alkalithermobacter thermoalcaliphilus JW-YL-7 = DSM 7308 TaxID=1121328 RepID=A0A150FRA3_CLOPD|nr:diaminopimelate decarboxylase [[Clostridium] paradoxum JW-YL-7 = DSM 7308]SHL02594.1 diaminopimelate decarboxylase [[Clostridium] paradoxum JW-YL-7 = DSM 7308]